MKRWIQHGTFATTVLLACPAADEAAPPVVPAPRTARPTILLAGCHEVSGPECVVGTSPATLRVWIDQQEFSKVRVLVDDSPVEPRREGVDGGFRLHVEVPESAESVVIEGVEPRWEQPWSVGLRHRSKPAVVAAADEQAAGGDLPGAIARLEEALESASDDERIDVLDRLQAFHFERGDLSETTRRAAELSVAARRGHRPRLAAQAASSCVYIYAYRLGQLAAARPFLAVLDELAAQLPEARVWAAFSRGLVARSVGDMTRAVDSFRESAQLAERLGMPVALLSAREALGVTYGELARGDEAVALARRMLADAERAGQSCTLRYTALNTAGWVQLLLQQRQVEHLPPLEFFERALALVGDGGECPSTNAEINVRINLALTELAGADPAMALAWLEPIPVVPASYRSWVDEVETRAGLALGRDELLPSPLLSPRASLPRGERWNALMGRAAVLERLGMRDAAIESYRSAEDLVAESLSAIGVDLGRELFLSGRQASARALVLGLVRAGREAEALCHARLARGRALRRLDRVARLSGATPQVRMTWEADAAAVAELRASLEAAAADDWQLSTGERDRRRARRRELQDEAYRRLDRAYERIGAPAAEGEDCDSLPPLGPGEVVLMPFVLDDAWLVFVSDGVQTRAREVRRPPEGTPDGAWVEQALGGARAMIDGALRLRILPTGRSADVPFHALAWDEGHLLDVAPVTYALDLVRAGAEPLRPGAALVVADPKQDLPLTRQEAQRVQHALERHGWTVERLEGRSVTSSGLEASLAAVDLLHYAGHGEHGGTAGWGARLLKSEGEGFGVADVLASSSVPKAVVLSGCETGRTARDTLDGGMNLGRAFILAGGEWVVATDRRVSDELSSALGEALYDELPEVGWDGPRALRRVQRRLRTRHPEWDWAAFRAVVR